MAQELLILVLFAAALVYIVYMVRKQFVYKKGCPGGCGCSGIDLEKIEKDIAKAASIKP